MGSILGRQKKKKKSGHFIALRGGPNQQCPIDQIKQVTNKKLGT
jgi:hypothetical protein